jgi:hypothetical protein
MIPRLIAPAPELEHYLDCAQECAELDSCSAFTLRLYGDDAAMKAIMDSGTHHYRSRREKCMELAAMADAIMAKLSPQRRAGLIRSGMMHLVHEIEQMAECLAGWAIEDEIEGGCLLPYRTHERIRNGKTFKNTDRRIHSPKFIRRYVKKTGFREFEQLIALTGIMLRRARETTPVQDQSIIQDWRAQHHYAMRVADRRLSIEHRSSRRMVRRSFATAVSIVGLETVRALLRGEQIKLIGQDTMLMLRKRGSVFDKGHGCLSVAIADRSGIQLADLCTYIEGTPLLDQVTGFALWMQSGEEQRVLETANIIELSAAGREHPIIAKRNEATRERLAHDLVTMLGPDTERKVREMITGKREPRRRSLDFDERKERNHAYWTHTKDLWMQACVSLVIGYRNLPIFKACGAL